MARGLKGGRVGGPSIIWAEDLEGWLWEALWEKNLVRIRCQLLWRLIQRKFKDGVVLDEVTWAMMVFLPKGEGASGDRACGGSLECQCGGGKFSAKAGHDPT